MGDEKMEWWKEVMEKYKNERQKALPTAQEIPAQNFDVEEEKNDSLDVETEETDQTADEKVEEEPEAKIADKVYFDYCHNYVFHAQATRYLLKIGLYKYIDDLQIGYDTETKEIIFPIDDKQYYAIKIENNYAISEKYAEKVIEKRLVEIKEEVLKVLLDELKYQGETAAVETFSYMIRMGLLFSRNGTSGKVKILPIIGRGHWQLESWEKFRQLIQKDKKSVMPIVRAIRLFENGKLRYNAEKVSTKK